MARRNTATKARRKPAARPRWMGYALAACVVMLALGLLGASYHYLSQPGRMPLRVVEVKGEFRHLSQVAISETAGAVIDGGFFTCDMTKLRNAVLAMPWVDDVAIRRVWPDRLVMQVTERKPLARWGRDALVSRDAEVFQPENIVQYAELPQVHGPDGSAGRVLAFYREVNVLAGQRDLAVRAVTLDDRRHWWVDFAGGLKLSLGRSDRDARLGQFLRVYPQLVVDPLRQPERVDMRYAHGFAVKWREGDGGEVGNNAITAREEV